MVAHEKMPCVNMPLVDDRCSSHAVCNIGLTESRHLVLINDDGATNPWKVLWQNASYTKETCELVKISLLIVKCNSKDRLIYNNQAKKCLFIAWIPIACMILEMALWLAITIYDSSQVLVILSSGAWTWKLHQQNQKDGSWVHIWLPVWVCIAELLWRRHFGCRDM